MEGEEREKDNSLKYFDNHGNLNPAVRWQSWFGRVCRCVWGGRGVETYFTSGSGGGGGRGLLGFNWKCNCIGAYIWKKDAQCVYSRISKIHTIPKFEKILFACLNCSALFSGICT